MTAHARLSAAVMLCALVAIGGSPSRAEDPMIAVAPRMFQLLGRNIAGMAAHEEVEAMRTHPEVDRAYVASLVLLGANAVLQDLMAVDQADRDPNATREAALAVAVEAMRVAYNANLQIAARNVARK